jgi:hypothetical protein
MTLSSSTVIRCMAAAALILAFGCCSAQKTARKVPSVIKKQIAVFSKSASCNDAHVDEMLFQKAKVYLFDPGRCGADMTSDVYDAKGKLLGTLGGIRGNVMINGEDFDKAKKLRTVWVKPG